LNQRPLGSKPRTLTRLSYFQKIRCSAVELSQRKWQAAVRNHSRLPYVVRPPATRRKVRTLAARQHPDFLHKRACLRSSHDLYYPLPLTTDDASYSRRFAAIPDVSRTREAGLAWIDRARWLGETLCCVSFAPFPTVSSARPLLRISAETDDPEFGGGPRTAGSECHSPSQ
jgi:hypothetical protein